MTTTIDLDRTIPDLTSDQADGFDCVHCGISFVTIPVPHVPVSRSVTGSQVFACRDDCATDVEHRLRSCAPC